MNDRSDEVDELLNAQLERKPDVPVPLDFAARVSAQVAAMPVRPPRRRFRYGPAAMLACAVLVLAAMFALVPWSLPSFTSLAFDMEVLLTSLLLLMGGGLALLHTR